ncbi:MULTISPECIES: urease accessory protein UreF [Psychrobacter]|uniref:urease accessory protein UreF n=1 Tax=Psychrobacter TaxID=497 RepID=UPI000C339233|nr:MULTISPECIES: urease accessory UreF family protein [Psychrobacter]PKG36175.1 urease accessory protein UreF [Psychrobacter sp. Sarcosine-3u-12]
MTNHATPSQQTTSTAQGTNNLNNTDVTGRLLMLASSNLPIGSYTYSQGIEPAIESGLIHDESSSMDFMSDYLELALCRYELPLLALMIEALMVDDVELADALGADYHASRESKEFVYESSQLALSLSAWLDNVLELNVPDSLLAHGFLPLFAHISSHWQFNPVQAMTTYAFGQIENMVLAAVKTVPLGQMAGQRIIWQLQQLLSTQVYPLATSVKQSFLQVQDMPLELNTPNVSILKLNLLYKQLHMSANLPNLAILSCQHERQYSRLFRS